MDTRKSPPMMGEPEKGIMEGLMDEKFSIFMGTVDGVSVAL